MKKGKSIQLVIGNFYFNSKHLDNKYKLVGFSDSGNNAFLSFNGVDMENGGIVISKNKLIRINSQVAEW
jgi:hypothetical protein